MTNVHETIPTKRIRLFGIVQGVGFRPFVSRIADRSGIRGSVANKGSYVEVFAQADNGPMAAFLEALEKETPERSVVLKTEVENCERPPFESFEIIESEKEAGDIFVSPDIATCDKCKRELFDPSDRRYLHPFINCTACGPRLTILDSMPYDRVRTSMGEFPMCPTCEWEYTHAETRRYDAQPVCCNECGPEVYVLQKLANTPSMQTEKSSSKEGAEKTALPEVPAKEIESTARCRKPPLHPIHDRLAIIAARKALAEGRIVAIKGIGGFHLACDATNEAAVARLRTLKRRPAKPFAVMARNLDAVRRECVLEPAMEAELDNHQKPILLLPRRPGGHLAPSVAPDNPNVGVMLPYAPVQMLLFDYDDGLQMPTDVFVMTSGNVSGAPICRTDEDALAEIADFTDLILSHDRKIRLRADDSVMDFYRGKPYMIRRSRGYAPLPFWANLPETENAIISAHSPSNQSSTKPNPPVILSVAKDPVRWIVDKKASADIPENAIISAHSPSNQSSTEQNPPVILSVAKDPVRWTVDKKASADTAKPYSVLAIGGELKNTFCVGKGQLLYPSPYVGDMGDIRTVNALRESVRRLCELLEAEPEIVACDLHPRYNTSAVAREFGLPVLEVQHHYAHILSCMAENEFYSPVIGVSMDGTGYGTDGTIWGGEILIANLHGFTRAGSIYPFLQVGGDASAKEGWRIAISMINSLYPKAEALEIAKKLNLCTPLEAVLNRQMQEKRINAVPSTSAGRLFDAVSAILGIRLRSTYEGEASITLQFRAEEWEAFVTSQNRIGCADEEKRKSEESPSFCHSERSEESPKESKELTTPIPAEDRFYLPTNHLFQEILKRRLSGEDVRSLAYDFHRLLAAQIIAAVQKASADSGLTTVALSGGVFQNKLLLRLCDEALEKQGFTVLRHSLVPPNDGGLSLGQALAAMAYLRDR